ncbi:MAG: hypothetical protein OXH60_12750 [Rhodospirillales bacterium]|nr:hypothetical protein [Rhodospirillales bacterium]
MLIMAGSSPGKPCPTQLIVAVLAVPGNCKARDSCAIAIAGRKVRAEFHDADESQRDFQGKFTALSKSLFPPGPDSRP